MLKCSPMPTPMAVIIFLISWFSSILSRRARSTLRIFPRRGRVAWKWGGRPRFFGAPPEAAPPKKNFQRIPGLFGPLGPLTWHLCVRGGFSLVQFAGGTGGLTRTGRGETFIDDDFGFAGSFFQVLGEHFGGNRLDNGTHLGVVEFGFGLGLELGIGYLDADDGGQTLAHIVTGKVAVLFF